MEAFEHIVKVYLESQGYTVSSNVKFPVTLPTKKRTRTEVQTHGYEVDVVGSRVDDLILGSVKSFFGSKGVNRQGFDGIADSSKKTEFGPYRIFNDQAVRNGIIAGAMARYGFPRNSVRIKLFVGRFSPGHRAVIEEHLNALDDDGVRMAVEGLEEIMDGLIEEARKRTYINDPVIMTIKALDAAGLLSKNQSQISG